jgi:hypothetical protein
MNSVTAVLVALVLIVVVLLVVWLVLRSRGTTSPGRGSGPDGGADPTPPSVVDRLAPERAPDGTPEARSESGAARDRDVEGSPGVRLSAPAAAEEYVAPGLADTDTNTDMNSDSDGTGSRTDTDMNSGSDTDADADGDAGEQPTPGDAPVPESGGVPADDEGEVPPRTPAEAFGDAHEPGEPVDPEVSGDASDAEAARREGSVLDETDVDSTPLFRSIREEHLGVATSSQQPAESSQGAAEVTSDVEPGTDDGREASDGAEDAVASDEVLAEEPEIDLSWSHERRGWDEQVHAGAPVTGGNSAEVVAPDEVTSAPGTSSGDEDERKEPLVEMKEKSVTDTGQPETAVAMGEHPPIRRISELHEVVDGGFGIGSAAVLADGAQPLGHPIKANLDTKTYQDLHSPWYDDTEPDVWFLDAGFAERAGFRRAEQD